MVGYLTEGRYLVAEKGGSALTNSGKRNYVTVSQATEDHESINRGAPTSAAGSFIRCATESSSCELHRGQARGHCSLRS